MILKAWLIKLLPFLQIMLQGMEISLHQPTQKNGFFEEEEEAMSGLASLHTTSP
jgi:hypothetical protein